MKRSIRYVAPPNVCGYLPEQTAQLEYQIVSSLTTEEYSQNVHSGWRRFGPALFRPQCPACSACQPIRILVDRYKPDRSQRRVEKANQDLKLIIGKPAFDEARADLYQRHHQYNAASKGWPEPRGNPFNSMLGMVEGPLDVEEWSYYLGDRLVAVSYIDALTDGYSGMYYYHEPELRERSLGTFIVISLLREAARRQLPYVYLGYFVKNCRSMEYKARFLPNQVLRDGLWEDFLI
jgi:arginine-tRNA-protein transferase